MFRLILTTGPERGYFPKPTKTILFVKSAIVEQTKTHFDHLGFISVTGTRRLGGFIGTTADKLSYIQQKVSEYTTGITCLFSVSHSSPQATFTAFQQSYHHEW